jgi:hypothetical protein
MAKKGEMRMYLEINGTELKFILINTSLVFSHDVLLCLLVKLQEREQGRISTLRGQYCTIGST